MKMLFTFLFAMLSLNVFGQIKIKVDPLRPVYKEPYEINFTIQVEGDEQPQISFTPINIEVLSKNQVSSATQVSFINGKSTMTKTLTYSYEVVSSRFGNAYLKDIVVEAGGREYEHESVRITVLQQPQASKKIFVKAEPDKDSAFVGESIIVRYYLYARDDLSIPSTDVRKFPKLNKFLKRFHQEQVIPERVRLDGRIYVRRVIYTAQVFGEKPGTYEFDPLSLKVGYSDRSQRFGGFSFQMGKSKSTSVSSPRVEVEIKSLPATDLPKTFTGLVGDLDFKAKLNKNKFIVNEPIEIELEVSGEAAFELFDPPSVLPFSEVEEFDKKADLVIRKDFKAIKKIEYTYLARSALDLKNHSVEFSYFDPAKRQFETKTINLGDIKISGAGAKRLGNNGNLQDPVPPKTSGYQAPAREREFNPAPFLKPVNTILYNAYELSLAFGGVVVFLIIVLLRRLSIRLKPGPERALFKKAYSRGVDYKDFVKILSWITSTSDLRQEIDSLDINENSKDYFKNLLDQLNEHYQNGQESRITVKRKFFKELEKLIERKDDILYRL